MALVIRNLSPDELEIDHANDDTVCEYVVKLNHRTLAYFTHRRSDGAAACFRVAADAVEKAESAK